MDARREAVTGTEADGAARLGESPPGSWSERLLQRLDHRPFTRNVSLMLGGAAGGQMISIMLSPLLTRLYSPHQFGILGTYTAILSIAVVAASLRYEFALPLAQSDDDVINLAAVGGCALVITTALFGTILFSVPEWLVEALWPVPINWEYVQSYRGLLLLGYVCLGAYFIALYLATRRGDFAAIAKTRLAQGVVGPFSQIGLGLAGAGAPGLLIGSILGQSTGTAGLFRAVLDRGAVKAVSWRRMAELARRYIRFPLISSWAALIEAAGGNQLLYLLISTHYSVRIAGFVFLAERVVARPLAIVGTSVLQVFVGEAGRTIASDPAAFERRFRQVVSHQFALAAVWVATANVAGTVLFPIVFGATWSDGIIFLRAMSIGYLAQATVQPVFHTLQLLECQSLAAAWQMGRFAVTVAAFLAGTACGLDAPWVIGGYCLAQAVACVILLSLMVRSIRQRQGRVT